MTEGASKIVRFEELRALSESLRARGQRVVQSHGIFDLMHPGHICHLEEARSLGDVLVVTVTADKEVQKGPGRPYFNETLRGKSLAALSCVDYIVTVPFPGAVEAIEALRPHVYCRGKEYEDPAHDPSGRFQEEIRAAEKAGVEVRYIGSIRFSSTKLLNQYFDPLSAPVKSFCHGLAGRVSKRRFVEVIEDFARLKVLVLGDTIFDRYAYLKVQGLTSKNRIISGRFLRNETQCGGALAVFNHVRQFSSQVRFISLVGNEPWVDPILREHLQPGEDRVVRDGRFTTIIKERFVEPLTEGKELGKLFSVNYIDAEPPPSAVLAAVESRMREEMAWADVVLLLDFGHGLMQPRLRELAQESAPFLALNCQTNSNNHGFNIISRQYQRADAFTLDEQELMLSAAHRHLDFEKELSGLQRGLKARYAWLTRGAVQTIGLAGEGEACLCPPLEVDVVDTIGAGDAFFSVAALAAAQKLPIDLATFLGQLAGAQAVKIVGNARPISKQVLVNAGMSLLNF